MHPMLNMAVRAARRAGDLIARSIERADLLPVDEKAHNDFVTQVDRDAEALIIDTLHRAYPDHAFLAEEGGGQGGDAEYRWVIDPLDGTANFIHGYPQVAVSIALERRGRPYQAVIYDPLRGELFTASRGEGAQLDKRRIRVGRRRQLEQALLGTGFPARAHGQIDDYLETFRALFLRSAGVRRAGSAALDLAWVACGRLDAFWEFGLKRWDMAAGSLIIQEAGGLVGDPLGGERHLETGDIVAGNPHLFRALLTTLRPYVGRFAQAPGSSGGDGG